MTHLTSADLAWTAVILGAFAVFWVPVIIAAVRQVDRIGLVVLFTLLGLGTGGVMWFAALLAAFILPRRWPSVPPRQAAYGRPLPPSRGNGPPTRR
jgi:hypothetical protein